MKQAAISEGQSAEPEKLEAKFPQLSKYSYFCPKQAERMDKAHAHFLTGSITDTRKRVWPVPDF